MLNQSYKISFALYFIFACMACNRWSSLPIIERSEYGKLGLESFPTDADGIPEATPMSEVKLSDGDSYTMEARAVRQQIGQQWVRRLAYNGSVPGPIFRVKQGSSIYLILKNSSELSTTLHPHGLRIDSRFDGVVGVSQSPIEPGQSFEYQLTFPDMGVYWYHPHVREDYAQDAGLYGIFIVEPSETSVYNAVHRELPFILDDILIDPRQPFKVSRVDYTLMGRYGNVNLVNGLATPTYSVATGEILRIFVLNAADTRVFALAIPGAQIKVVGGDNGLYENESWADHIILGPGERAILEIRFGLPGKYDVINAKPDSPAKLAKFEVKDGQLSPIDDAFNSLHKNPDAEANLKSIRSRFLSPIDKELTISLDFNGMMMPMTASLKSMTTHSTIMETSSEGIEWDDSMPEMNRRSDTSNVTWQLIENETSLDNMNIHWRLQKGQYVHIRIHNESHSMHLMQHPLHFHGQRFVIAAIDGKFQTNLVWKDTALIPGGKVVDIILEASNAGKWIAHCHIAEHMEAAMTLGFDVVD